MSTFDHALSESVISSAFTVMNTLGDGFLERVYQFALAHELLTRDISATCEKEITVHYRDIEVGSYYADILVDDALILEIKCVDRIVPAHIRQLRHYLIATGIKDGLIINFMRPTVEVRRVFSDPFEGVAE